MNAKIKSLYFSRFEYNYDRGGGCRRFMQIKDILDTCGVKTITQSSILKNKSNLFIRDKISDNYQFVKKIFDVAGCDSYFFWNKGYREKILHFKNLAKVWLDLINAKYPKIKYVLIDDPIYFSYLVKKILTRNIPVVAILHNIESLSFGQADEKHQLRLFLKEIELLKKCRFCVTISREETTILRNFGIEAVYVPYYPVPNVMFRLKDIRKRRTYSFKDGFLFLGTVGNIPTKKGMLNFVRQWQKYNIGRVMKLYVGGYNTNSLKNKLSGKDVMFLGAISNDKHDSILSKVKANIVYQETGSGALTKIAESLAAGVPIIANSHAIRSYYNMRGIFEFNDFQELSNYIQSINFDEIEVPVPAKPSYDNFVQRLRCLSS